MSFLTGPFYYEIPNQVRNDKGERFVLWGVPSPYCRMVPISKRIKQTRGPKSPPPPISRRLAPMSFRATTRNLILNFASILFDVGDVWATRGIHRGSNP